MTTEEAEALANFVNVATGRANIKNKDIAKILNGVAFAPRYALSRIQYLLGSPLWKAVKAGKSSGDMRMARTIAKEYLKFYASVTAIGVGLEAGASQGLWEAELDPRSANFMKVGIRNNKGAVTWFDMTGGLGSYFKDMYRVSAGAMRAVQGAMGLSDPAYPLKNQKGEYTDNLNMAVGGWFGGKSSPLLGTGLSAVLDFDRKTGQTKSFGETKSALQLGAQTVTPISAQTAIEGQSDKQQLESLESWRNFLFEFFGVGNNTVDIGTSQSAMGKAMHERSIRGY